MFTCGIPIYYHLMFMFVFTSLNWLSGMWNWTQLIKIKMCSYICYLQARGLRIWSVRLYVHACMYVLVFVEKQKNNLKTEQLN